MAISAQCIIWPSCIPCACRHELYEARLGNYFRSRWPFLRGRWWRTANAATSEKIASLFRYGRTALNATSALLDRADDALDEASLTQAADSGDLFANADSRRIFSNPLLRPCQTTVATAEGVNPALNGRNHGEWTGTGRADGSTLGIELRMAFAKHVLNTFIRIVDSDDRTVIATAGHDAVNQALNVRLRIAPSASDAASSPAFPAHALHSIEEETESVLTGCYGLLYESYSWEENLFS